MRVLRSQCMNNVDENSSSRYLNFEVSEQHIRISEQPKSPQREQLNPASTSPPSSQTSQSHNKSERFIPSRIKKSFRSQAVLSYNVGDGIRITSSAEPTTAAPLPKRRMTISCMPDAEQTANNIKIKLLNARPDMGVVKVVLNFQKEGPEWCTKLFRSYEGDIWQRVRREPAKRHSKWIFQCNVCGNHLCSFPTMRSHLNSHYGFFPYSCTKCHKKYPSNSSLIKHRKKSH